MNDPREIVGEHDGMESVRKPDIVIVSKASAESIGEPGETWHDYAKTGLKSPVPTRPFGWGDVLSSVEVKAQKKTLERPPSKYTRDCTCPVDYKRNMHEEFDASSKGDSHFFFYNCQAHS